MFVRSTDGTPLFVLDGDVGRDSSGKPIVLRAGDDKQNVKLAAVAASAMTARARTPLEDERTVLMDLANADISNPSTQAQFAIPPGDFIADVVSQVKYVTHDRGYWYVENVTDAVQIVEPNVDANAAPPEINPAYGKTQFVTVGYALAAKLPRDVVANADWDIKRDAARLLANSLRLAREKRVASLLTTTANWPAANQVAVGANKWNGGSAPNPLGDMFSALSKSYLPANLMIMPEPVAPYFYANQFQNVSSGTLQTSVRDYVQSGGEMPRVLFARAKYFSGGLTYVWAPALPYNVPVIRSPDSIPSSVTFRWIGKEGNDGDMRDGMLVRTFTDPRDNTDWIVVAHNDLEIQVSNQVGAVIVGAMQ